MGLRSRLLGAALLTLLVSAAAFSALPKHENEAAAPSRAEPTEAELPALLARACHTVPAATPFDVPKQIEDCAKVFERCARTHRLRHAPL